MMTQANKAKNHLFAALLCFIIALSLSTSVKAQNISFDDLLERQLTNANDETAPGPDDILSDQNAQLYKDALVGEDRTFEDYNGVKVRILDKVTAQSQSFELEVGKTVAYGGLRIHPKACKKTSPIDEPESVSFLQIWERYKDGAGSWIFSGWMFASSPSLSAMEHPVYDVWILDCVNAPAQENETVPNISQ